jgi:hypothetical protein
MTPVWRVLCGIAAGSVSFWIVVRVFMPAESIHSNARTASTIAHRDVRSSRTIDPGVGGSASAPRPAPMDNGARDVGSEPHSSSSDDMEQSELRNSILVATGRDMRLRHASVLDCLNGVELAGTQKIRLAVYVVSTANEAKFERWSFVEIVDGQELPGSFPGCVETALGGGGHVIPRPGTKFPVYDGKISMVYRIEAPND